MITLAAVYALFGAVFVGAAALSLRDRRFAITVRLPEEARNDVETLRRLPIALPARDGRAVSIPLSEVATLAFVHHALADGRDRPAL